ncbi:MAG: response regulator transcription factor [Eubacterium sp.]|nr:response regulator transcription factor [Eubacterium sp.]
MKIVIVDDDSLVAVSLKTIIEAGKDTEVLATGRNGEEAIALYRKHHPDVLLMDIRMEGMTGLAAGQVILEEDPGARILFLTTFNDDEYIRTALAIGAKGYIIKQDFDGILPALRAVYGGQTVFGDQVVERLPDMLSPKKEEFLSADFGLTEQESEIVKCVAEGLSNREIAEKLFLSEGTVRNYLSNILSKLDLRDRTNLAIFYYKHR